MADDRRCSAKRSTDVAEMNEEEKEVEMFYELMDRVKAMKEIWKPKRGNKKAKTAETAVSIWKPSFEPDDFAKAAIADVVNTSGKEARLEDNCKFTLDLNLPL